MHIEPDTGAREAAPAHPDDPHHTASGSAASPGGAQAPAQTTSDLTHGQESYAGPRDAGETDKPGSDRDASTNNAETPPAGDVDPESTASTDETGQAGINDRPGKDTAHPWNG
jgi:hypothetical protein